MSRVFIRYAREDSQAAEQITVALLSRGMQVLTEFSFSFPAGVDREQAILQEMDECDCVLVLWSANASESHRLQAAARHALARGFLIQVRLDNSALPEGFGKRESLTAASPDLPDFVVEFLRGRERRGRAALREESLDARMSLPPQTGSAPDRAYPSDRAKLTLARGDERSETESHVPAPSAPIGRVIGVSGLIALVGVALALTAYIIGLSLWEPSPEARQARSSEGSDTSGPSQPRSEATDAPAP